MALGLPLNLAFGWRFRKGFAAASIIALGLIFAERHSRAEPSSEVEERKPSAPTIMKHSKNALAAFQGDTLKLSVEATGNDLQYRWMRSDKTICRRATCELDTSDWVAGEQKLILVVFNSAGSQFVRYGIKLLSRPPETSPRVFEVPLVDKSEETEQLLKDDFFVTAFQGIGYSFHSRKVDVLGELRRPLSFGEQIRAHREGIVLLGRPGFEEHFLFQDGHVQLGALESGERWIQLLRGALRSRDMSGDADPTWSIMLRSWGQVDVSQSGDVVVELIPGADGKASESARVMVLRGFARVFVKRSYIEGELDAAFVEGRTVVVPQGAEITVAVGKEATDATWIAGVRGTAAFGGDVQKAPHQRVTKFLTESSPHWFDPKIDRGLQKVALGASGATTRTALSRARRALERDDPVLALEWLAPHAAGAKTDANIAGLLARAYQQIGVLSKAKEFAQVAIDRKGRELGDAGAVLALVALETGEFDESVRAWDRAEDLGYKDDVTRFYYSGVARYQAGRLIGARTDFVSALWAEGDQALRLSAENFIRAIDREKFFHGTVWAGAGYDSNPWRLKTGELAPNEKKTRGSAFYDLGGKLRLNMFHAEEGSIEGGFDISRRGYLDQDLNILEQIQQELWLALGLSILDDANLPMARVTLRPKAGMIYLGEFRSFDFVGIATSIRLVRLSAQPAIHASFDQFLDPDPAAEDPMDPPAEEALFFATERTHRVNDLGLSIAPTVSDGRLWMMRYDYRNSLYRQQDVWSDNYDEHILSTSLEYDLPRRSMWLPRFSGAMRKYPDDGGNRKDSRYGLGLGWRWHYTPALYQDVDADVQSVSSTEKGRSYFRSALGWKIALDL